ncbi:MAG: hypothetical protein P8Y39_02875 [Nitrospirota bacterium]
MALLFVNAWFWGNAALEYFLYHGLVIEDFVVNLNQIPEKVILPETNIDGEQITLFSYAVKMPFLKEERNIKISPHIYERSLSSIDLLFYENDGLSAIISFSESPWVTYRENESLYDRFREGIIYGSDRSCKKFLTETHYSRLSDLSWWNPIQNLRSFPYLFVKLTATTGKMYDVKTPHIAGFLRESADGTSSNFEFCNDDKFDSFHIALKRSTGKEFPIRDIVSTITKVDDIDEAYTNMKALYENNPGYPERLLILSMISLKGPQENYQRRYLIEVLKEQLEWVKENYKKTKNKDEKEGAKEWIEEIQSDIEYYGKRMQ